VAWLDRLMADARQGGPADTTILTQAQYGQLVTDLPSLACCIQSVAQQLNSINPAWRVTPAGIEQFLADWCYLDIRTAVSRMFATIPGADVRTLPTLNQLLSLIQRTCRFDPAKLDWTSQQLTTFAVNNSRRGIQYRPVPPPERSNGMRSAYQVVCAGLQGGLSGWLAERVRGGKANFFVGLAIEAAFVFCPDIADQLL
jgi:hypothetical protein